MDMEKLSQDLEELEERRLSLRNSIIISVAIVIVVALVLFIFFSYAAELIIRFLLIGAAVGIGFMFKNKKRRYKKLYNAVIVRSILDNYFEIKEFNSDYGVPKHVIEDTKMIKMGNTYAADDYIEGLYKGLEFFQSDVCIQDVHSNGKTTTTVTYFKGRWMVFEFNKDFVCDMLVHEKSFSYADHKHGHLFGDSSFQKVEFENIEFNNAFKTYSDNQNDAFYIMTPHMMDSIMRLRQMTDGDLILCFKNNKLHVGVNNKKNAFEPPIFSPIDVRSISNEVGNDIGLITQFVDELRLDEKIYKV